MKLSHILFSFPLLVTALCPDCASAQTVTYGAYSGSETLYTWGTNKKENYDVAIKVSSDALVGKTITGVRIPFAMAKSDTTKFSGCSAFITKALTLSSGKNVPDVESQSFKVDSGFVQVTFAEPYTITSDGVYVGYSFTLDSVVAAPIVVTQSSDADFFYLHSSRTYRKFISKGEALGVNSAMQVLISGIEADRASVSGSDSYVQYNTPGTYSFTITNEGSSAINSIDYSYELAGQSASGHYDLPTPIPAHLGASQSASISVPAISEAGEYTMKFKITKVNGNDNVLTTTAENAYHVLSLNPKNRPLLEEYTGTWCGWCPRGFVGLEHMNELLGYDFVGVSYHNEDPMQLIDTENGGVYASSVSGFPAAYINRVNGTDAYCGDVYDGHFGIDKTYANYAKAFAPAALEATASLSDDLKSVTVNVKTTFAVAQTDGRYQLTYILTANGLSGATSSWNQSNYYSSYASSYPDDDMKQFTSGSSSVSGLVYNFVVVGWNGPTYQANSLPASVDANSSADAQYTFDLSGASGLVAPGIIQDYNKLDAVVALIDTTTGAAVNSIKVKVTNPTGIRSIENEMKNVTAEYYSLDGKKLSHPVSGINIVRLSNGKTVKAVIRN